MSVGQLPAMQQALDRGNQIICKAHRSHIPIPDRPYYAPTCDLGCVFCARSRRYLLTRAWTRQRRHPVAVVELSTSPRLFCYLTEQPLVGCAMHPKKKRTCFGPREKDHAKLSPVPMRNAIIGATRCSRL